MLSSLFRRPVTPEDKFHPSLHSADRPDDVYDYLNNNWNIVLSCFSDISDFENIALVSYVIVFEFLKRNNRRAELLINSARAKLQKAEIKTVLENIMQEVSVMHKAINAAEEKRMLLQKPSLWTRLASFVPGGLMIGYGAQKIVTASQLKNTARDAILTQLAPTCVEAYTGQMELMADNIIDLGTEGAQWSSNCADVCSYWSSTDRLKFSTPPACDNTVCMNLCDSLYDVRKNNWDGGWLIAVGGVAVIAAAIVSICCLGELDQTSLNSVLKESFSNITNDVRKKANTLLRIDDNDSSSMSIAKIMTSLSRKLKSIEDWLVLQNTMPLDAKQTPLGKLTQLLFAERLWHKADVQIQMENENPSLKLTD
jgi:hypothetical protein